MWSDASRAARPRRNRSSAGSAAGAPLTRPGRSRSVRRPARRRTRAAGCDPTRRPPAAAAASAARPPPRRAPPRAGLRERLRVRRAARQPGADEVRRPPAAARPRRTEADAGLALPGDRALVGVVDRPDRLEVRREVALRVGRAAPEDVAGPPGAPRDEVAVAVLRADDLERQRIRRRRALLLDVVAVRVARAADERPEPAALADERPLAALRADLALAGLRRRPRRRAAAAIPCAPGTASRRGTGRSARGGSPSGGPPSRPRRSPRS